MTFPIGNEVFPAGSEIFPVMCMIKGSSALHSPSCAGHSPRGRDDDESVGDAKSGERAAKEPSSAVPSGECDVESSTRSVKGGERGSRNRSYGPRDRSGSLKTESEGGEAGLAVTARCLQGRSSLQGLDPEGKGECGMDRRELLALLGFVVLCFAAAGLGALFTFPQTSAGGWYSQIRKPSWTPPSWLFGPVWTALYLMMAVAAWWVWRQGGWEAQRGALALFLVQLVLNAAWSGLFFGLHSPSLGMAGIVLLWIAILLTILAFFRVSPLAGWLMVPYLLWVSFASALNFTIWRLNG
jgi:benzodiazapine receptor